MVSARSQYRVIGNTEPYEKTVMFRFEAWLFLSLFIQKNYNTEFVCSGQTFHDEAGCILTKGALAHMLQTEK